MEGNCIFEGCSKKKFCKGYCTGHYQQLHRGQALRPLERKWEHIKRTEEGKNCSKCGKHKPWTEYQVSKRNKDGKQAYCKSCSSEHDRKRREEKKVAKQLANANRNN